jgi:hypothetical protein
VIVTVQCDSVLQVKLKLKLKLKLRVVLTSTQDACALIYAIYKTNRHVVVVVVIITCCTSG